MANIANAAFLAGRSVADPLSASTGSGLSGHTRFS
jgi:hypothetical protein